MSDRPTLEELNDNSKVCWSFREGLPKTKANLCLSENIVIKQGFRCSNGCVGEGAFSYSCDQHRSNLERLEKLVNEGAIAYCRVCDAPLTVFPIQEF